MKVGLLTAMGEEAEAYQKQFREKGMSGITAVVSGIGKVNAAIATIELILNCEVDAVFIGGVCASLTEEPLIRTYLLTHAAQYDYAVEKKEKLRIQKPGSVPGAKEESIWYYADDRLISHCGKYPNHNTGILTGDLFVQNAEFVHKNNWGIPVGALDMETGAVAQVCEAYSIPWIGLKTTTDRAGSEASTDFWDNLEKACRANAQIGQKALAHLLEV